jgi:hypothetical protein
VTTEAPFIVTELGKLILEIKDEITEIFQWDEAREMLEPAAFLFADMVPMELKIVERVIIVGIHATFKALAYSPNHPLKDGARLVVVKSSGRVFHYHIPDPVKNPDWHIQFAAHI